MMLRIRGEMREKKNNNNSSRNRFFSHAQCVYNASRVIIIFKIRPQTPPPPPRDCRRPDNDRFLYFRLCTLSLKMIIIDFRSSWPLYTIRRCQPYGFIRKRALSLPPSWSSSRHTTLLFHTSHHVNLLYCCIVLFIFFPYLYTMRTLSIGI